jgi:arylsulfatase A-like enzyme/tetratricopeptide (TPR) repeat protein
MRWLVVACTALAGGCRSGSPPASGGGVERPSILLVTLDTTRADAIGPEASVATPAFNALAGRGRLFRHAFTTVPETLPAHASLMTGLYPGGHGVHENARPLPRDRPLVAERLREAGYKTAAFVSSFVLARRFGLARGFEVYDDELPEGRVERSASATTARATAWLQQQPPEPPVLLWVHYFEPHHPYEPPEPFRSRYPKSAYHAEVAAMDESLGRLVDAFDARAGGARAIVVVGDHGEGLKEHGELQHGRLLYQATMHVPLVLVGPGIAPGEADRPVSARRVFHTLLDWAGLDADSSLRGAKDEIVLGEAMKPFLAYGWQPQVMGVEGSSKLIQAGRPEVYDLGSDPFETKDLGATARPSRALRDALREYPIPSLAAAAAPPPIGEEERRKLASLGYVSAGVTPVLRPDAPRPADMARLFDVIDEASTLFVREDYRAAIPLLQRILAEDRHNLDAALRLATAHSALGQPALAEKAFEAATDIAPGSPDVRAYRALHHAKGRDWEQAVPVLEQVLAEAPDRLPALETLAFLRERQGREAEALELWRRVFALRPPSTLELAHTGELAMTAGQTEPAIQAFEAVRAAQGAAFAHDLQLGVLYLAAQRFTDARDALDRVPPSHPSYPMVLFKRAQVSVLLHEPDQKRRIELARQRADATTRKLIARERLFRDAGP